METKTSSIISTFFESFKKHDPSGMMRCYHRELHFSDPVFGSLNYKECNAMWEMLLKKAKGDLQIDYSIIEEDAQKAKIKWQAKYTFSKTKRKVHNKVKTEMILKDGLIYHQSDSFNLYHWMQQAFGWKGRLLGWSGFFRRKLRSQTKKMLMHFMEKNKFTANKF